MAWLPTGLTAIVVCDHRSVKPTGVRAGAGRRGHLPATTAEVRATAMPKLYRHAQVLQCVERLASAAAKGRRLHAEVRQATCRSWRQRCSKHDHSDERHSQCEDGAATECEERRPFAAPLAPECAELSYCCASQQGRQDQTESGDRCTRRKASIEDQQTRQPSDGAHKKMSHRSEPYRSLLLPSQG